MIHEGPLESLSLTFFHNVSTKLPSSRLTLVLLRCPLALQTTARTWVPAGTHRQATRPARGPGIGRRRRAKRTRRRKPKPRRRRRTRAKEKRRRRRKQRSPRRRRRRARRSASASSGEQTLTLFLRSCCSAQGIESFWFDACMKTETFLASQFKAVWWKDTL